MSVYGIETEDDCRMKIDALLAKVDFASNIMNRENISDVKADLKKYFRQRDDKNFSKIERQCFWPAIHKAYVRSRHLGRPQTWRTALYEIRLQLKFLRPAERN